MQSHNEHHLVVRWTSIHIVLSIESALHSDTFTHSCTTPSRPFKAHPSLHSVQPYSALRVLSVVIWFSSQIQLKIFNSSFHYRQYCDTTFKSFGILMRCSCVWTKHLFWSLQTQLIQIKRRYKPKEPHQGLRPNNPTQCK